MSKEWDGPLPSFGTAISALLKGFEEMPSDIEIHVVSASPTQLDAPEKLASNIWFHQPVIGKWGWTRSAFLGCAIAIRRKLGEIKPDIVHGQGTERDCAVAAVLSGYPNVITIHGHMARIAKIMNAKPFSYYWLVKTLESIAIRHSGGIVAITNYTRDRLGENVHDAWLVPNAVDPGFFDVNGPGIGNIALCVGGLNPWKRQLELIQALDFLPEEKRPNLVLLGSGAKDGYAGLVLAACAERSWCSYVGTVTHDELKDWLTKAGILILPSTEDNCPMVILEAMAAGVPVVASRIGGIPDLIEDGRTGYLFDPLEESSIRQAVLNWAKSPEDTANLAKTAKQEALLRFHPRVIAERHMEIYREVLGR